MAKRGNHEGTIYKRKDGRWLGQVTLPDGKRKSFYGKTRKVVQEQLIAAKAALAQGLTLPSGHQTIKQYLDRWLEGVASEIRPGTFRRYRSLVRLHVVPELGSIALNRLSAQQLKLFYSRLVAEGLSPTTVHGLHGMIHRALEDALDLGLLQQNVAERVKAPRKAHKEMHTLSEVQAQQLLEAARGDRLEALYVLALTTGMRQGEMLALHWADVDLEGGRLMVRYNAERTADGDKSYQIAETKTPYSRRTIGLSHLAIAVLKAHKLHQKEERLRAANWQALDLVFPNRQGGLMLGPNVTEYHFKKLLKKANLPNIRFHDLRHTAATISISRGVPIKVVSEMLGHADISITLRIYAHVTPHMQQAAVDVMDAVFGG